MYRYTLYPVHLKLDTSSTPIFTQCNNQILLDKENYLEQRNHKILINRWLTGMSHLHTIRRVVALRCSHLGTSVGHESSSNPISYKDWVSELGINVLPTSRSYGDGTLI